MAPSLQWDFRKESPLAWMLRDKPGVLHGRGANLTFADGHVELRRWQDVRTVSAPRNDALMPANLDVLWLQRHATWRDQ